MKVLIQRVKRAYVEVDGATVGAITAGILALVGIEPHDNDDIIQRAADRIAKYRLFTDQDGKMNLSVEDINGGVLVVSQFTLAADTKRGLRPSFSSAASPAIAERHYLQLAKILKQRGLNVATGQFGADMQVTLQNDGPVTFWLEF